GSSDMARDAGYRHGGRDAEEDQERCHQEPAADAEHPGDESDRNSHRQNDEDIHRQVGDGKIHLHGPDPPLMWRKRRRASRTRGLVTTPLLSSFVAAPTPWAPDPQRESDCAPPRVSIHRMTPPPRAGTSCGLKAPIVAASSCRARFVASVIAVIHQV